MQYCDHKLHHHGTGKCVNPDIISCITNLLMIDPTVHTKTECINSIIIELSKLNVGDSIQVLELKKSENDTLTLLKYYKESSEPIEFLVKDGINHYCITNRKYFISLKADYEKKTVKGISGQIFSKDYSLLTLDYIHIKPNEDEKSVLFYPISNDGKIIGVLKFCDFKREGLYNTDDLIYVVPIVEIIGRFLSIYSHIVSISETADKKDTLLQQAIHALDRLEVGERLTYQYLTATSHLHELKNILFGMTGDGEFLKYKIMMSTLPREDRKEMIQLLQKYTKHRDSAMTKLEEIMAARPMKVKLKKIKYNFLNSYEKQIEFFISQFKNYNIIHKSVILPKSTKVYADRSSISYIIRILINNAISAVNDGRIRPKRIHTSITLEDDFIVFAIRDNGIGIPQEHFRIIFEAFFSTKEEGGGIGLFWARKIMNQHGGSVNLIKSIVNKGSYFKLKIPKYENR